LTRRGAQVTVLEERFPGAGSTGTSFGWVHAGDTDPDPYFTLRHAAVHAHHALGYDTFVPTGHLTWATGESQRAALATRVERLRAREYSVERITAARAAGLEPGIAPGPDGTDFALFPEEGHVFPMSLLGRFVREARAGGASIETGVGVREIGSGRGQATVTLADGSTRTADVVVCCAGRWSGLLVDVPLLDPRISGALTNGFQLTTTPLPARLTRVLTAGRLDVHPDGGGRLLLRAPDLDAGADPDLRPGEKIVAELIGRLSEVLTDTANARVERVQVAQRAVPAGGPVAAGFLDAAERVYAVAARSGVTLAPLLADLVAGEVHGEQSAMLAFFRPDTGRHHGPADRPTPDQAGRAEQARTTGWTSRAEQARTTDRAERIGPGEPGERARTAGPADREDRAGSAEGGWGTEVGRGTARAADRKRRASMTVTRPPYRSPGEARPAWAPDD
jgi:glycine/D-amino acid oxidase-like deaminating enzyme